MIKNNYSALGLIVVLCLFQEMAAVKEQEHNNPRLQQSGIAFSLVVSSDCADDSVLERACNELQEAACAGNIERVDACVSVLTPSCVEEIEKTPTQHDLVTFNAEHDCWNVAHKGSDGRMAVEVALERACDLRVAGQPSPSHDAIVRKLAALNAVDYSTGGIFGKTLFKRVLENNVTHLRYLQDIGAVEEGGVTPLQMARENKRWDAVCELIKPGDIAVLMPEERAATLAYAVEHADTAVDALCALYMAGECIDKQIVRTTIVPALIARGDCTALEGVIKKYSKKIVQGTPGLDAVFLKAAHTGNFFPTKYSY